MYKYNSVIGSKIFRVLIQKGEMNSYKLKKITNESLGSYHPSDSVFKSTKDQLLEWHLIQRMTRNVNGKLPKSMYTVSEFGRIIWNLNYEPHHVPKFLKLSQIICVSALIGITFLHKKVGKPERGTFLLGQGLIADHVDQINYNKTGYYDGFIRRGTSKEDIMEKRYRHATNYQDLDFTTEEVEKYFKILIDRKLIKPFQEQVNEIRYSIFPDVERFFSDCWISLFNSISYRIEILSKKPKRLSETEKKWYKLHHGEEQFNFVFMNTKLWKSYEDRYKLREKLTTAEVKRREKEMQNISINRLKEIDNEIVVLYDLIVEKYKEKIIGFPGFKELIISFVCPQNILEIVRMEINSNNRTS